MTERAGLIAHLAENTRVLETPRIRAAFEAVDRADFVPEDLRDEAYEDYALPIGHGQTVSQPTTVAFMLELLDPEPGQRILDVGSGSGWTTALLSHIAGSGGSVLGLERVPELVAMGSGNLVRTAATGARIEAAGNELGRPSEAPFDRILVSAAAANVPADLVNQLAIGGIMVIPVEDAVVKVTRESEEGSLIESYEGFAFVPLEIPDTGNN